MTETVYLTNDVCSDCGRYLTPQEYHFYTHRCEGCEGKWFRRIEAWRHGGEDQEFDRLYGKDAE